MVSCFSFVWCSLISSIGESSLSFGEIGFAKDEAGASADRSLDLLVLGELRSIGRWTEEYWSVVCTYTGRDVEE